VLTKLVKFNGKYLTRGNLIRMMSRNGGTLFKSNAALILFAAALGLWPTTARAQDPSQCFNQMLLNHYDFSQRENLLLSALTLVNNKEYDSAQQNASLSAFVPEVGLFDGKYNEYSTRLREFFQYNKLDITDYRQTLLRSAWLGDQGYEVIDHCLDNLYFDGDGFRSKVQIASASKIAIQFKWSSPQRNSNYVLISDSNIVNGSVEGVPNHKLFRRESGPLRVSKATVPIFVTRDSVTDPIFITVATNLDRQPGVIRIDPVTPEKPLLWRHFVLETGPDGKVIHHSVSREIRADSWTLSLTPSEGYEFAEEPTCTQDTNFPLAFVHIVGHEWDHARNSFTCWGTQNANPRYIDLGWVQGKWEETCVMRCDLAAKPH
jgi:hypothetical protein